LYWRGIGIDNDPGHDAKTRESKITSEVNNVRLLITDKIWSFNAVDNTLKLDVTSDDIVQMLLHPQKAVRLPTMKLSLKSHQDYLSSLRGVGLGSSSNNRGGPLHRSIDPLLTLPPIDQCTPMQKAYHGSIGLQSDDDDDDGDDDDNDSDDSDNDDDDDDDDSDVMM
jgi:hypothetical protein